MNINPTNLNQHKKQQSAFRAIGTQKLSLAKTVGQFKVSGDDFTKISEIADLHAKINEVFHKNKSVFPQLTKLFNKDTFNRSGYHTFILNSIIPNFKLSLLMTQIYKKQPNNELFSFIVGEKEKDENIIRFRINKDGNSTILTDRWKINGEAQSVLQQLKKTSNNTTYLDNILNTVKDVYSSCLEILNVKQNEHINTNDLNTVINNIRTIEEINRKNSNTWVGYSKETFFNKHNEIKYDFNTKLFSHNDYLYNYSVLNGKNNKDSIKIAIHDSQEKPIKIFIIRPNGKIYNRKKLSEHQKMTYKDIDIALSTEEEIEKYNLVDLFEKIKNITNSYKTYITERNEKRIKKSAEENEERTTRLDSSDAKTIIANINTIKAFFVTHNGYQIRKLQRAIYNDWEKRPREIICGKLTNSKYSHYACVGNAKNTKDQFIVNLYNDKNEIINSFVIDQNGIFYKLKSITTRTYTDDNLKIISDREIQENGLKEICENIKSATINYLNFINNETICTTQRSKQKHNIPNVDANTEIKTDNRIKINETTKISETIKKEIFDTNTQLNKLKTKHGAKWFEQIKNEFFAKNKTRIAIPFTYEIINRTNSQIIKIFIFEDESKQKLKKCFIINNKPYVYKLKDLNHSNQINPTNTEFACIEDIAEYKLPYICKIINKINKIFLQYATQKASKFSEKTSIEEKEEVRLINKSKTQKEKKTISTDKRTRKSSSQTKSPTHCNFINNTELYRILTKIFDTQPSERNANIIPYVGSNNKIISAKFKFITSDGKTLQITKALTPWGINKFNYCIEVYDEGKTYYYRIDGEKNNKIIECDAQGHIILTSDRQLKHITQEEYCEKYPFMAEHFKQYAKEISKLIV
ncbi:MAG: hypothetical protein MJ237_06410 [bacterium]|nr:hypothetical protein [bacterium]